MKNQQEGSAKGARATEGDGVIANVYKFFTGKYQGEKKLEKFLHKYGEARITSIRLFRQPVSGVLQKAVDWFTKGDLETQMKKNAYDKLFHLSMYIVLSNGADITLEKNARLTTHEGKLTYGVEAQSLVVFTGEGPELRTFIYNAIKRAGLEGFFVYDAFSKNCQDFIYNCLEANGMLAEPVKEWIRQNLRDVATKHPTTSKFFTTITDIAGIVGSGRSATTVGSSSYDNPTLWEEVKAEITAGSKGGKAGQWSARKAQMAVVEYKRRGGGYTTKKDPDNSLVKWTKEDWRTKSGKPSLETGERYLPSKAIEAITDAEYQATTRAKRKAMKQGEQFSAQPEAIAKKTKEFRASGIAADLAEEAIDFATSAAQGPLGIATYGIKKALQVGAQIYANKKDEARIINAAGGKKGLVEFYTRRKQDPSLTVDDFVNEKFTERGYAFSKGAWRKVKGAGDVVVGSGKGTDNFQLAEAMKGVKGFRGVFPIDELPARLHDGDKLIVNYQSQAEGGSHWIGVCVMDKRAIVFDSFGVKPPTRLLEVIKKSGLGLIANSAEYQMSRSDACGEFAVYFLTLVKDFDTLYEVLYEKLEPSPVLHNELVVKRYFASQKV